LASKEKQILEEVVTKYRDFESRNMAKIANVVRQGSELYLVSEPSRKKGAFSNPRLTEFHRAANALATMVFRMHTAHDPFWSMQLLGFPDDYAQVETIRETIETQLLVSKFKKNHLRGLRYCAVDGSVVFQEDYSIVNRSASGLPIPVTHYRPRRIDQIAYDDGAMEIESADWVATADLISVSELKALKRDEVKLGKVWIPAALDAAISMEEDVNTMDEQLKSRLERSGLERATINKKREVILYYGRLDAMNDGMDYVVGIINRRLIVRFHANNKQHGKRQFRFGNWIDWDRARGYGLTELFSRTHTSMDANMQKMQDAASFDAYSMWAYRSGAVDLNDAEIAPFAMIPVEDKESLWRLESNSQGLVGPLKLQDMMIHNFRTASLANDTLQGIASDGTATASALAQNESLRAIGVIGEILADDLVRDHIGIMHANNQSHIDEAFELNVKGTPRLAYPRDFRLSADFRIRVASDKDSDPTTRRALLELLQVVSSTKTTDPTLSKLASRPIIHRLLNDYGINPSEVDQQTGGSELGASEFAGLDAGSVPGANGEFNAAGQGGGVVNTPVGPVQVSQ
jgi:hypothetical protein